MCHRLPAQKRQRCSAKQDQNPENTEEHRIGLISILPTHIHGMAIHICTQKSEYLVSFNFIQTHLRKGLTDTRFTIFTYSLCKLQAERCLYYIFSKKYWLVTDT